MIKDHTPKIYYNDDTDIAVSRRRYSIFHEVKHFVNRDNSENAYDEEMADYFAKYFMCPIPYLVYNNITDTNEIISKFNVSYSVACSVSSNVINRQSKYGQQIFDYEKPLINSLYDKNILQGGVAYDLL